MTPHQNIQNPDDYSETDYQSYEQKLFAPLTSVDELEEICMTLAHLPTKRAQDLLGKFKKSRRASQVGWLDIAIEEGQLNYLSPNNEAERRDYLAVEVVQELEHEIIELEVKYDEFQLDWDKQDIIHEAVRELVKLGEAAPEEEMTLHDNQLWVESKMAELRSEIALKEKTVAQIKTSIKTDRYKNLLPQGMVTDGDTRRAEDEWDADELPF
jgi:hypothetical protein